MSSNSSKEMKKVLMVSADAKIFEEGSFVRARMIEYGSLFSELHIVVFSVDTKLAATHQIAQNVFAYPTRSLTKLLYVTDGISLGMKVLREGGFPVGESVITTQDPFESGLVGVSLSKKSSIPLHVQIHTDFQSPYFKTSALNKIRIAISKRVFPHARAIRAVSERIIATLPPESRMRAKVLPIYADIEAIKTSKAVFDFKKIYPQFLRYALIASRLTKEKDIVTAIKAFAEAHTNIPAGTGLLIVGSGPEEAALREEARVRGVSHVVVFVPWVDHETLMSYMRASSAFISSSLYEGYGLSMLEAHTAGVPLVATDAGIAPLLVADACLVRPGDVEGMASALQKVFQGTVSNKSYTYPYSSRKEYLDMYRADIERTT